MAPPSFALRNVPRYALAPLPLPLLQPLFTAMVRHVASENPALFSRLGTGKTRRILIDPENFPFVLLLCPDPARPRLTLRRRRFAPSCDARISASFLTFLALIDGHADSDSLFFARALRIEGDTETVVALRNALDDMDKALSETLLESTGVFSAPIEAVLSVLRRLEAYPA